MRMSGEKISDILRCGRLVIIEDRQTRLVTRENAMDVVDIIMKRYHDGDLTWPKMVKEMDTLVSYLSTEELEE